MGWRVVLTSLLLGVWTRQINPVSVLLPYTWHSHSDHRVNVTLQAFGGCYQWRAQRPNIIKLRDPFREEWNAELEGEDKAVFVSRESALPSETVGSGERCHNTVVVAQFWASNARIPEREKSWVFADDAESGVGVKCEVYVAPIASFVIETTAKSLTVGGAETLRVRAFDKEGNVFTSLEGLRFEWEIGDARVVQVASLKNDVYRPSPARRRIHEQGEQSDIILLKGLGSGRTTVQARLLEPGYESVPPAQVELDIIEPIAAVPATLFALPRSQLTLGVKVLRGRDTPAMASLVKLPNPDFTWRVADPLLLEIHPRTAHATVGGEVGETAALVADQRNENNTDVTTVFVKHVQSVRLHQAPLAEIFRDRQFNWQSEPGRDAALSFLEEFYESQFSPVSQPPRAGGVLQRIRSFPDNQKNTWYLPRGRPALFAVDVLSAEGDSLFVSSNARLAVSSNATDIAAVSWLSHTQALGVLAPLQNGSGFLTAQFLSVEGDIRNDAYIPRTKISTTQRFVVVDAVQIQGFPEMKSAAAAAALPIVLPVNFQAHFQLIGGSGSYRFSSSDETVCSLSHVATDKTHLLLSTHSTPGLAVITVSDESNESNFYKIHCLAAEVDSIHLDSGRHNQYPLSLALQTPHVNIPVRAVAKLPLGVTYPRDIWIPREEHSISSESDLQLFAQCHRNPLHFTLCQPLSATLAKARASQTDLVTKFKHRAAPQLYECGFVQVTIPDERTICEVSVALAEANISDSANIEFYHPISPYIAKQQYFDQLGVDKYRSDPTGQLGVDLSSNRIATSVAIAVGSRLAVSLIGGPSLKPDCDRQSFAIPQIPDTVNIQKLLKQGISIPNSIQGGDFLITCLKEVSVVEINFQVKTTCVGSAVEEALNTQLVVGCSIPVSLHLTPDDTQMPYRVSVLSPLRKGSKLSLIPMEKSKLVSSNANEFGTSRIFIACGETHQFQMVALDQHRRPLLAVDSFNPEWQLLANRSSARDAIRRVPSRDAISIQVPGNYCNGDLQLEAILSFKDFPHQPDLSRHEMSMLKSSAVSVDKKLSVWKLGANDYKYMNSLMELQISPQPKFLPQDISNEILVDNSDWAYRLMTQYGSGTGRYFITGASNRARPSIVSIVHFPSTSSMPGFDPKRAISKSWSRVMNLVTESDVFSDSSLFSVPIFTRNENEICMDEVLVKSDGSGEFEVNMEDPGLLGGVIARLKISFQQIKTLDLQLTEMNETDSLGPRLVASQMKGAVSEIEADVWYAVKVLLLDKQMRQFSSRIALVTTDRIVNLMTTGSDVQLTEREGQFVFCPHAVGKLSIRAESARDRLLASPSLELIVHKPLRLEPESLTLLPGRHTWEVGVHGGGSHARDLRLVSSDPTVCDVVSKTRTVIRSGAKGVATLTLRGGSEESNTLARYRHASLEVVVAYPSYVGFIRDGLVQSSTNGMVTLVVGRPSRLLGALFAADHRLFTLGHLLLPSGTDAGDDHYACRFTWISENPKIVTFLQDEVDRDTAWLEENAVTITRELKFAMFPRTSHRVSGIGKIAVFLMPVTAGSTRLSLNAECVDRKHWGAPFTRWSDTAHVSVFVNFADEGLNIHGDVGVTAPLRIPVIDFHNNKYLSILPSLYRQAEMESPLSIAGDSLYCENGEPFRVLLGTRYRLHPKWAEPWTHQIYCETDTGDLKRTDSSVGGVQCKHPSNYRIEKSEDELVIDVPNSPGANVLIVFSNPHRQRILHAPFTAVHPDEIQILPVTSLTENRLPLPTPSTVSLPLKIQVGEKRSVKLVLKQHQKAVIPDHNLDLNILVSHGSIANVRRDLTQPALLHIVAMAAGCSSLTVSLPAYPLVVDTILVCVNAFGDSVVPVTTVVTEVPPPLDQSWHEWTSYFLDPWVFIRHGRWLIVLLVTVAVGALVMLIFLKSLEGFQREGARLPPKPAYVSDWASNSTPTRPASMVRTFPTSGGTLRRGTE
eukprot:Gregarina_sp_Poly_1__6013@NODE_316_length_9570_cov_97_231822_g271_i0_p1_GENE_NODE_316_length_9570_cov_97_231822_g271_i0NODE_316_length_9570_cov_97_231822_g271_i0_p1_ORF_typecomplete_len1956_score240_78_NODE_316_length_9570_cov_97_231822_g271_i012157082